MALREVLISDMRDVVSPGGVDTPGGLVFTPVAVPEPIDAARGRVLWLIGSAAERVASTPTTERVASTPTAERVASTLAAERVASKPMGCILEGLISRLAVEFGVSEFDSLLEPSAAIS